jgi:segregation and condensation protein B
MEIEDQKLETEEAVEPVAVAEQQPVAVAEPQPEAVAEPQPEAVAEPQPEAVAEQLPVAVEEQLPLAAPVDETGLRAAIEAIVYVCEEPATAAQIAIALQQPQERIEALLAELVAEFAAPAHGLMVREVAGGYKMATKAEHHEAVRAFAKSLKPALKLSLAALETLATIAYKQPVTAPEIMEIRGVQGAGVLKTLLDRKLIQTAGRKNVVGRPILYRTSKEFLMQFGLKDLSELPTLKEFEELRRLAAGDEPENAGPGAAMPEPKVAGEEPEAARADTETGAVEPEAASSEPEAASEASESVSEVPVVGQASTPARDVHVPPEPDLEVRRSPGGLPHEAEPEAPPKPAEGQDG